MKIKTKKTMTLPQLIEWAWENEIKNERFIHSDSNPPEYVWVNENSEIEFDEDMILRKSDLFTVEAEEEITEDTMVPKLMTTFKKTYLEGGIGYQRVRIDENYPIKLMLNKAEAHGEPIETLHIVNDDGTHTLIWRDGKLVE
ncbi:hypothetical protein ASS85_10895 [Staphylococcus saprophyticus]|uniref:hypothetical protein n=1 Tax=Staphylococcus saprophyticus TaxID=29385 RepID=UPI000852C4FB|nr:hypothetical protein [Staphylococcus saprophyticus]MDW4018940.1 hypothetical protein [Staphylococcus saprophyticus]OEK29694.1 hypothetical protein ASS85_10895 [Staphylococcus saprophyticus]